MRLTEEIKFIDTIIQKIGAIVDTSELSRTMLIFEILSMVSTLKERITDLDKKLQSIDESNDS